MSMEAETVDIGGLSLYTPDENLPDYVSSDGDSAVGSSVSKSSKNTMEINAEMFNNAMLMVTTLQAKVISLHLCEQYIY